MFVEVFATDSLADRRTLLVVRTCTEPTKQIKFWHECANYLIIVNVEDGFVTIIRFIRLIAYLRKGPIDEANGLYIFYPGI
jgi:hypothetical protein